MSEIEQELADSNEAYGLLFKENGKLKVENQRLRDVLQFYADKEHVTYGKKLNKNFPNVFAMKYIPLEGGEHPAYVENGEKARKALKDATS